jgi:hypothetical protein
MLSQANPDQPFPIKRFRRDAIHSTLRLKIQETESKAARSRPASHWEDERSHSRRQPGAPRQIVG